VFKYHHGTSTGELDRIQWKAGLSLVSYGVRIGIRVSESNILEQLQDYLPPGWEEFPSLDVDELYSLVVINPLTGINSIADRKNYFIPRFGGYL